MCTSEVQHRKMCCITTTFVWYKYYFLWRWYSLLVTLHSLDRFLALPWPITQLFCDTADSYFEILWQDWHLLFVLMCALTFDCRTWFFRAIFIWPIKYIDSVFSIVIKSSTTYSPWPVATITKAMIISYACSNIKKIRQYNICIDH